MITVVLFTLFFNLSLMISLSFGVRGIYLISRDKLRSKVPFGAYPMFSKVMSFIFLSVTPRLLIQLLFVSIFLGLVMFFQFSQNTSMLLFGLAILCPTGLFWYYLPPTATLTKLYQSNLLMRSPLD